MENNNQETIQGFKERVLQGELLNKDEGMKLAEMPLEELCKAANEIRYHFCKNGFDLCTIINGKSGKCSEDCKYCAQSSFYPTKVESYPMLPSDIVVQQALNLEKRGVLRYSIVTSGKRLSEKEVDQLCFTVSQIRQEGSIEVCVSAGLLDENSYSKLKKAGVSRVHNNLETSRRYFPQVCTTHSIDDKIAAIKMAQESGLNVCSGGIMGMGETMEDRIDLVLMIRELGIRSIPVNMLNPIPGTPFESLPVLSEDEMRRIVAVFRFLVPDASIRLAGGRGLLSDKGRSCFCSGANAAISGDMLTTSGITIETDLQMLKELGYEPQLWQR
ncbi:MAG: biotin synthase BioB [Clostridiales bacterium]|nr:biotin synthase BioB [Clostridiales bacterium]